MIKLNDSFVHSKNKVNKRVLNNIYSAYYTFMKKNGAGSDYLGWVDYVDTIDDNYLNDIEKTGKYIKDNFDYLVVIGIGGSYIGSKSAIDFLSKFENDNILFVGYDMSIYSINRVINKLKGKKFALNVISKSGETLETAVSFEIFKNLLIENKQDLKDSIFVTTDKNKGILIDTAKKNGYKIFYLNENIGGRYSVYTPVGLLPISAAGFSIKKLIDGIKIAKKELLNEYDMNKNHALKYAYYRHLFYKNKKVIEVMTSYDSILENFILWNQQLFSESEGKDGKGLFPIKLSYTTDLHSVGQMIQDGKKNLFETIFEIENKEDDLELIYSQISDKLYYLKNKTLNSLNKSAMNATCLAHYDDGIDNLIIKIKDISEQTYGYMIYFFMVSCSISSYAHNINPYNQPGVESYKKNMYALIDKKGYENLKEEIIERLKEKV